MTQNLLKIFLDICNTFSTIATFFTTPINELLGVDIFGSDITILTAMLGAGLTVFIGYTLLKWVIPT